MKKSFFYYIAAAFVSLLWTQNLFAQDVAEVDTLPMVRITAKTEINRKVHDAFHGKFKDVVGAQWYRLDENYLVKFFSEDQKNHALYNKNGYLYYHIVYGSEKSLPEDVMGRVKTDYKDAKVLTAIQVNQESRSMWILNIDYGKLRVVARDENGVLREVERVKKGS